MKSKNSKTFWIILAVIIAAIGALSVLNCMGQSTTVNYSEFYSIVDKASAGDAVLTKKEISESNAPVISGKLGSEYETAEIGGVLFDGYVVNFTLSLKNENGTHVGSMSFTTNYSRQNVHVLEEKLNSAGIDYNYTDPNAGSMWSSLLPLAGCVLIAVVFFIIMMQTHTFKLINQKKDVIEGLVHIRDIEGDYYIGRTEYDSPDVDTEVLINVNEGELLIGNFYNVRITDATEFDLMGTVEK